MDLAAFLLSLRLAAWTTFILLGLGLPIAWWLASSRWRWKFLVEAVVALPLVLPPTVLGFYLLVALGPRSPLGKGFEALVGHALPFSFEGLLLASVLYSLPFSVQPFSAALAGVDRRLLEASWCLGVSRFQTFVRIVLPLSATGILSGMVLTFAHTLGEFGVVLMVGGNLEGRTRTSSIAIYDSVQALDYASAGQTSLVLLAVSFAVLTLTYGLQRGVWTPWFRRS
ncbi:molybdate ABC transporter permease subunit [Stigmatella aurantiaca]|uniref:Molybdenum transport system permease n=1 Tax=Stigmatella aurantiaca (strain DW4/3-1) TaxID=378806 RepID=Q09DL5_STIAD|nr:molybdate ABC transporter permease subunit [Stigmatella aurantiaca]ADO69294.1 Molybdate ABC transporter, permease protein [Stigmatella aurantiaca DW4/3-1]EAU69782.1 molybdate ABC transporter, permease protein [Stigmatella aurantiaca DW4/3-1]